MASRALDIVVRGRDQASGVFGRVGNAARSMGHGLGSIKGLLVGALGGYTLKSAAETALTAWGEQEQASAKLAATLRATGGAAGWTAAELEAYSSELQNSTTFADEAITNAQAILATFTNIKGDNFKTATQAMLDMTATLGGDDLKGAANRLGRALNDPVGGLTTLTRVGITFSEQQKQQIKAFQASGDSASAQSVILDELKNKFGGVSQAMAQTATGSMAQFKNAVGEVWESLGQALAPAFVEVTNLVKDMLPALQAAAGWFGDRIPLAADSANLALVGLWEDIKYAFTTTLPTYASWFTRNWKELFIDAANAISYGVENMAMNIWTIMKEVWSYISTWGEEGFAEGWKKNLRGIMDGFRSVVTEQFPEVADRASTALEMALASSIEATRDRLRTAAGPMNRLEIPVVVSQDAETRDFVKAVKAQNNAYTSRLMRYAPGQTLERGYTVKVAPDPKTREISDGVKKTNVLLSRLITATEAPTKIDAEVYDP